MAAAPGALRSYTQSGHTRSNTGDSSSSACSEIDNWLTVTEAVSACIGANGHDSGLGDTTAIEDQNPSAGAPIALPHTFC